MEYERFVAALESLGFSICRASEVIRGLIMVLTLKLLENSRNKTRSGEESIKTRFEKNLEHFGIPFDNLKQLGFSTFQNSLQSITQHWKDLQLGYPFLVEKNTTPEKMQYWRLVGLYHALVEMEKAGNTYVSIREICGKNEILQKLVSEGRTTKEDLIKYLETILTVTLEDHKPAKINVRIARAIAEYDKYGYSVEYLAFDFAGVLLIENELPKIVNPYETFHKKIGDLDQYGRTVRDGLFNLITINLKGLKAHVVLGVILEKHYCDPVLEDGYIASLSDSEDSSRRILVVNPSPDFVGKTYSDHNYEYLVERGAERVCYQLEFEKKGEGKPSRFYTTKDENFKSEAGFDTCYIMDHSSGYNTDCKKRIDLIGAVTSLCKENGSVWVIMPNVMLERNAGLMYETLNKSNAVISQILLISKEIIGSSVRKKILVRIDKKTNTFDPGKILVTRMMAKKEGTRFVIQIQPKMAYLPTSAIGKGKTILAMFENEVKALDSPQKSEASVSSSAEQYQFSQEITLLYTIKKRDEYYVARAHYRAKCLRVKREKRNCLEVSPKTEKGLRAKTRDKVIQQLERAAYEESLKSLIVRDIRKTYNDDYRCLSFKTVWFLLCDKLKVSGKKYNEDIVKELVSGKNREVANLCIDSATGEEIQNAMNSVLCSLEKENMQITYYVQLELVVEMMVNNGFARKNLVRDLLREKSNSATDDQREARDALAKKTFTHEEEAKLLAIIQEKTGGLSKDPDGLFLGTAIRWMTGMSAAEVCALKWGDFYEDETTGVSRLLVSKYMTEDGQLCAYPVLSSFAVRWVVIPTVLKEILKNREMLVLNKLKGDRESLKESRIVHGTKEDSNCKPRRIRRVSSKVINALNIQSAEMTLPSEGKDKATDFAKYEGDIFEANFTFKAKHISHLTSGETNYLLGLKPPDPYSANYCDYGNPLIQLMITAKLDRWMSSLIRENSLADLAVKTVEGDAVEVEGRGGFAAEVAVDVVSAEEDQEIMLTVESELGCRCEVTNYGNSEVSL